MGLFSSCGRHLKEFRQFHTICRLSQQANMSERALQNGDGLPPVSQDVMRFYNMRFCPFAQRTRMVLLHKNIPHETVNVNLRYKPDWFLQRNPLGLVPVLEYKGQIVYESAICDNFLDQLYPENGEGKLRASCPFQASKEDILMHHFDIKIPSNIYGLLNPSKSEDSRSALKAGLHTMEEYIGNQPFFGGNKPNMVDFHVFPWFERFPAVEQLSRLAFPGDPPYNPMPKEAYPSLTRWVAAMRELPAVKKTLQTTEHHMEFMMKLKQRQPEYDIGLGVASAHL